MVSSAHVHHFTLWWPDSCWVGLPGHIQFWTESISDVLLKVNGPPSLLDPGLAAQEQELINIIAKAISMLEVWYALPIELHQATIKHLWE